MFLFRTPKKRIADAKLFTPTPVQQQKLHGKDATEKLPGKDATKNPQNQEHPEHDPIEKPLKKRKHSGDKVQRHLKNISEAVDHLKLPSEVHKQLLKDITHYSLGPREKARHEFQKDASNIIDLALRGLQVPEEKPQVQVVIPQAEVTQAEVALTKAQKDLELANDELVAMLKDVEEARRCVGQAKEALARIESRSPGHMARTSLQSYEWLLSHDIAEYEPPQVKENQVNNFPEDVQHKMQTIVKSLQSCKMLPATCMNMLESCVLYGLGPVQDEYCASQYEASQLVGKALVEKEQQLRDDVAECILPVGHVEGFTRSFEKMMLLAGSTADKIKPVEERTQTMAEAVLKMKQAELDRLQSRTSTLNEALQKACRDEDVAQENLKEKVQQKSECNQRHQDVCVLREGTREIHAKRLLTSLTQFFEGMPVEEHLVASFCEAALQKPSERGHQGHAAMTDVEHAITTLQNKLEKEEQAFEVVQQNCSERAGCLKRKKVSLEEQVRCASTEVTAASNLLVKVKELEAFRSETLSAYYSLRCNL